MHLNLQTCRAFAAALLLVYAGPSWATEPASSGDWQFGLDAHLWGAAIGGETTTGNEIDVSFRDILENLDFGLMAAAKAKKNQWSVVRDIINLKIKADNGENFKVPVGPFLAPVEVDAKALGIPPLDAVPATLQERAWTSPIWYTPDPGIAKKAPSYPGLRNYLPE